MAIDRAQVRHVARLARLSLTPAEEEKFAAQLSHVLDYIEKLSAVDVSAVQPLAFAGDLEQPPGAPPGAALRPDEVLPGIAREDALAAAPASNGIVFLVPRIIE
jgi:aspartyl-tRNA(Asn)/glutamyl-tRNA(Gln) amidotransferase subunit C